MLKVQVISWGPSGMVGLFSDKRGLRFNELEDGLSGSSLWLLFGRFDGLREKG